MTGPLNLTEAILAHMPRTLKTEAGASVTVDWQPRRSMPRGTQRSYPRGVVEILSSGPSRGPNRGAAGVDASTAQAIDSATFVAGTLSYDVVERDIASVVSVTGTRLGVAHTFVANTDYTFTEDAIVFTGTGSLPDDGTQFTRTYLHRLYSRRWEGASRLVVRAMLYVQDRVGAANAIGGKEYAKEALAQVLGESLEHQLRRRSGRVLNAPPGTSSPMTRQAMGGPVLNSAPGATDESESVAVWFVDFVVRRNHQFADDPVERVRSVDLGTSAEYA